MQNDSYNIVAVVVIGDIVERKILGWRCQLLVNMYILDPFVSPFNVSVITIFIGRLKRCCFAIMDGMKIMK